MVLAPTHTISCAVNRHQISIEPAVAGCSPIRDFVHRRFADAGRRWVWLRFPTAGIRKPLQKKTYAKTPCEAAFPSDEEQNGPLAAILGGS